MSDVSNVLLSIFIQQAETLTAIQKDVALLQAFESAVQLCHTTILQKHKLLIAGNGGSAADAQHWAAELVVRFRKDRRALPAIALSTDSSIITAVGNDFSFDDIFSRQIEALGQPEDVFLAITTSGRSPNIKKACLIARRQKIKVIGFTSAQAPQEFADVCDICLKVPAEETARIQEIHATMGHTLCGLLEAKLSADSP
jgi:D-sedoheptulose 7-phosphate isomerase